ncbi:hypothetical protein GGS26DRAFT_596525 [Hypomontagnella submonticulosa]|nr:hypothetical protein GGS26DRAFT_596525 [Hypomontagnella submonticulosa]
MSFGIYIAYIAITLDSIDHVGYLPDPETLTPSNTVIMSRDFFFGFSLYVVVMTIIKVLILLDWLRIFNPARMRGSLRQASHFFLWINIITGAGCLITWNTRCTPYEKNWEMVSGACNGIVPINTAWAATNLAIDVCILLLPQKAMWQSQTIKKRLGVAVILIVGIMYVSSI